MKKIFKAGISLIFCLCIVFTSMAPAFAALAQVKSLKVSAVTPTTITLKWAKVSGSTGYEVEQYVSKKWKKIASTTKTTYTVKKLKLGSSYKFRIRALKKSGNKVTYGKYSAAVTAKPLPAQVTGLKQSASTQTSVTIKWSKVSSAEAYRVQKYVDNKWVTVVKSTDKTSATVKSLAPGKKVSLRVCAIKKASNKAYYGAYSKTFKASTAALAAPKTPTASSITSSSVKISWKKVTGATSYVVYSVVGDTQKVVSKPTKNSCTVTGLGASKNYIFSVRACVTVNSKNYYSSFSENLFVKTSPAKAATPTATPSENSIKLSWKASSGADGYEIYKYNSKNKAWEYIGSSKKNSYNVIKLSSLTEYKFKIRAYHETYSQKAYGPYSDVVTVKTLIGAVKNLSVAAITNTTITITWSALAKADSYKIERSTDGKKWTAVSEKQTVSNNKVSVKVTKLSESTDYIFRVRAVASGAAGTPQEIVARTAPGKVTGLEARDFRKDENEISNTPLKIIALSWSSVTGAMGYELSCNDGVSGWKVIVATESTYYSAMNMDEDKEYTFKVRAYYEANKVRYYGPYSDVAKAKEYPAQIKGLEVTETATDSVSFVWNTHSKAEKYVVRVSEAGGKYNDVSVNPTVQNGKYSAKISSLKPGISYSIAVCAIVGSDESYPATVTFKTYPGKTVKLITTDTNDTTITISWDAVTGAEGYEIEKLDTSTNKYENIATISSITYIVNNLIPQTDYKFRVRAYNTYNGNKQFGAYSDIISAKTISASVGGLQISNISVSSVTVSWDAKNNAQYKVETVKNSNNSVSSTTTTGLNSKASVVLNGLEGATVYTVRVCALNGTVEGAWSSASFKTAPSAPKNLVASSTAEDSISTSWTAVKGADGYQISIKKGSASWQVIGTTSNDYYNITGLEPSTSYSIRVRAYSALNSVVTYSDYSSEATEKTNGAPVKINGFTATAISNSSVELSWDLIPNATYQVDYSENGSNYSRAGDKPSNTGNKTKVVVTGLKAGTTYYFRITATVAGETGTSNVVTAKTQGTSTVAEIKNLKATSSSSGSSISISISWSSVSGASYYYVICDSLSMREKVTSTSYNITSGLTGGRSYSLRVEACDSSGSLLAQGSCSCSAATTTVNPPSSGKKLTGLTLKNNESGKLFTISWDSIEGAVYKVQRWNPSNSAWEDVPSYKYTSRVTVEVSDDSLNVNYTKKNNYVSTISWSAVAGSSSYSIHSEISNESDEWKTEKTTSSTSVDLRLPPQSKQTIRVSAISDIKFRISALDANNETKELACSEYTARTYSRYGETTFTTPAVSNANSVDSNEAFALMLVQAINNTKLEKGRVTASSKKLLNADIDTNSIKVNGMSMDLVFMLFPSFKKEFESMSKDMHEDSETTCVFEYGYGKGKVTTTDVDGSKQTKDKPLYLKSFTEPEKGFAYLYDQHNINSFSNGVESITSAPISNGGYKIILKLKPETATATKDSNYHRGFTDNFAISSEALAEFGNESNGSISGTTITATVNRDYTLDSLNVKANFSVYIDVKDEKNSIKSKFNGNVDTLYTFSR